MSNRLTVSVVMATYNGEKHLIGQLDSIRIQTRPADEVIIVDDDSKDSTVSLLFEYVRKYNLGTWKIHKNESNIGWRKNFINAFNMASGDIIFCADQDDIWKDNKIEVMASIIEKNQQINVLACNIIPVYEDRKMPKLAKYYLKNYGESYIEQVPLDKMWMEVLRPGCSICFRKDFLPLIYIVWDETVAHDAALWEIGVADSSLYIVNEQLVFFKRHLGNNSPLSSKTNKERSEIMLCYLERIEKILKKKERLNLDEAQLQTAYIMRDFFELRYLAIKDKKWKLLFKLCGNISLYPKPSSFLGDFLATIR